MKGVFLFALGIVLVACAPAAPPVSPTSIAVNATPTLANAIPLAGTETTLLSSPTAIGTLTITPTTTRTATPTRTSTPTLPALPTPTGVTFKFDEGVPQDQRDTIIAGISMARAFLGESRPMTVIAFADLNGQMDEISRYFNEPRTSSRLRSIQQYLQADRANAYPHAMFFPMSKTWMARLQEERLRTVAHEYFHAVEGFLTNTDPFNYSVPAWLYEGSADFAAYRAMAKYGYYDLAQVHRDRIERTRGIVSPLSSMEIVRLAEREDLSAHYWFGYLADEMLTEIGGEQAVLRKFWENYPKYPGWQLVFKATFGITEEEFYKRFEETRRAQFPPYCGNQGEYATPAPNDPFAIKLVRQDGPGVVVFPLTLFTLAQQPLYSYTFCATGYPLVTLTDSSAYKYPPRAGVVRCGGNCFTLYFLTNAQGTYTFAIELPDKRRAEVQFDHLVPSTPTPKP